ncbi:MAG: SDR family oxidoreductase [Anaerolineales bacterium]|nr:SDR family oxidoreductase [Anaerolineales bacterium]
MKTIVITGSTRGIGFGLADAFLARGYQVVVNGRSPASVEKAMQQLAAHHDPARLHGQAGDVRQLADMQTLWDTAVAHFGQVDVWINNAGVGHPQVMAWEVAPETVEQVVDINLIGLIYGCRVAIRGMLAQGHGHVYNMEGFGSNGRTRPGITIYGATKAAIRFLNKALAEETEGTAVKVSALSPGMVATDFVTDQYTDDPAGLEKAKEAFNMLGDRPETVTPWLADKVLANDESGARIQWLTTPKLLWRLFIGRFRQRNLFDD